MDRLEAVIQDILRFREEREWRQFHTPKNLAAALSIEAAELQELMLWKTESEVSAFLATSGGKRSCSDEIADVLIFALLLCQETGINPIDAIRAKLNKNAVKYPADLARGNATKYSRLRRTVVSRKRH